MPATCPLCKKANIAFLFTKRSIPYYKCKSCGFIFSLQEINPNLSNEINDFEPAYIDYLKEKSYDRKNFNFILKKLKDHHTLTGPMLDFGCGSGKFVRFMRERSFEMIGLEPSRALYESFLKDEPYFYCYTIEQFFSNNPDKKFDVITAVDVMEHIEDPITVISRISFLLKQGGILFITTPDTNSFFARLSGKKWHYFNKYHLSLFSKKNFSNAAAQFGLQEIETGYVTRYQSMNYIVKYLFNFILNKEKRVPEFLSRVIFPVNLYDNFYGVFRKTER